MLLNFNAMEEKAVANMRGGEGTVYTRVYQDANNKVLQGRMPKGATIGMHTHEIDSEMIYILAGTGTMLTPDGTEMLPAGSCHYCPKGGTHSLCNKNDEDLVFLAMVPVHGA